MKQVRWSGIPCIQISHETGKVVWYSHFFRNFPQFVVIHTVKGFGIVNKAEIDVFLEFYCFFYDPVEVGNFISGSSAFSKSSLSIWFMYYWSLAQSLVLIPSHILTDFYVMCIYVHGLGGNAEGPWSIDANDAN